MECFSLHSNISFFECVSARARVRVLACARLFPRCRSLPWNYQNQVNIPLSSVHTVSVVARSSNTKHMPNKYCVKFIFR
jgi:hypothetical protein